MIASKMIIRGRKVVLPEGVAEAAIHIHNGRITEVTSYDAPTGNFEVVEAADESVVMPGLVDTHVHINEPGRTEWEGFSTATYAAAAGGTTTLIDMPLNSIPPTTTVAGLAAKLEAATNKCHVDVGFWGGVVPGNTGELAGMLATGVVGFKCFLVPSGVDEFPHVTENDLRQAMPELSRLGALLIVHAELPGPIAEASTFGDKSAPTRYDTFLCSRPAAAEDEAIAMMIGLSREFETAVHIVHLSSADALPMLRDAQHSGVRISAETCPHYLHFAAEDIPSGATEFKCCPPIRERSNREGLWKGLLDGTIKPIVSDHSPCPGSLKLMGEGDFVGAWGGIASLQLRLPVIWSEAKRRGIPLDDVTRWLCYEPAKLVGLENRKGMLAVGCDADVVIWDPEKEFRVNAAMLHHRHKTSPYNGETLTGTVQKTFLRGRKIYDGGEFSAAATGEFLLRR